MSRAVADTANALSIIPFTGLGLLDGVLRLRAGALGCAYAPRLAGRGASAVLASVVAVGFARLVLFLLAIAELVRLVHVREVALSVLCNGAAGLGRAAARRDRRQQRRVREGQAAGDLGDRVARAELSQQAPWILLVKETSK